VEHYPTVEFKVRSATGDVAALVAGKGEGTLQLNGQLTLRTATRDVSVPVRYWWEGGTLRVSGAHRFKWPDYGLPDPSIVISTLYPEVDVRFDLALRRAD
jgi:polyisoprenoid-binding protein YceI